MLDVDGGVDVDPGVEQIEDVLITLLVARSRNVGVRQLVDDAQLRLARQDRVYVHFLELDAFVGDPPPRDDFEIADLRVGVRPAIGLDETDDDVDAALLERARVLEHRVGLADAGRRPDVHAELGAVLLLEPLEQLIAGGTRRHAHARILHSPHRGHASR